MARPRGVTLPAWFVRLGGEVRLRAAKREAIAVDRLGFVNQIDLLVAFGPAPSELPVSDLVGAANPGDRKARGCLAAHLGARRILEIGTHIGASTAALASVAEVVSVDVIDVNASDGPWRALGAGESPEAMLQRLGWRARVRFVKQPSLEFMRTTSERFDLVFLDGDHSAVTVYRELAAASRLVNPGGFILLHDYFPGGKPLIRGSEPIPGPFRGVERACRENPTLTVRPLGILPWPTKLGSSATTLALAGRR
jgi:predicted O-methyltransferase YrrM